MIKICSECSGTEIECSARRCWGFVNGKRKDAPASRVIFPQPEVDAPDRCKPYWFVSSSDGCFRNIWYGTISDQAVLDSGNLYLTYPEAEQRLAWNKQDMAQRVIPKWFRDLGPDVQFFMGEHWVNLEKKVSPERPELIVMTQSPAASAKPKPAPDVVVNVNGKEYRWPATVGPGDCDGLRYVVTHGRAKFEVSPADSCSGNRTHHTREGAEAQCAALNAALGVEQ